MQGEWPRVEYSVVVQKQRIQPLDLAVAARAPPSDGGKLASTGITIAQTGSLRTLLAQGFTSPL